LDKDYAANKYEDVVSQGHMVMFATFGEKRAIRAQGRGAFTE